MSPSLSAKNIATELSISRSAAYEIMKEMPRLVHRRTVRVSRSDFEEWRARHTVEPVSNTTAKTVRRSVRTKSSRGPRHAESNSASPIRLIVPRTKPRVPLSPGELSAVHEPRHKGKTR